MATRFSISGFKFDTVQAVINKPDKRVLGELPGECSGAFLDEELNKELADTLKRTVEQGIPFPDLELESGPHIKAAEILCHYGQSHLSTAIEGWEISAIRDLARTLKSKASDDKTMLIDYLTEGRAIFGKRIEHTPQYYAYLLLPEVKLLRSCLKPYKQTKNKPNAPFDQEYLKRLVACGYGRELDNVQYDQLFAEESVEELDDIESALSRWLYEIESAALDMWLFVT
jgi:hypothetical protein